MSILFKVSLLLNDIYCVPFYNPYLFSPPSLGYAIHPPLSFALLWGMLYTCLSHSRPSLVYTIHPPLSLSPGVCYTPASLSLSLLSALHNTPTSDLSGIHNKPTSHLFEVHYTSTSLSLSLHSGVMLYTRFSLTLRYAIHPPLSLSHSTLGYAIHPPFSLIPLWGTLYICLSLSLAPLLFVDSV